MEKKPLAWCCECDRTVGQRALMLWEHRRRQQQEQQQQAEGKRGYCSGNCSSNSSTSTKAGPALCLTIPGFSSLSLACNISPLLHVHHVQLQQQPPLSYCRIFPAAAASTAGTAATPPGGTAAPEPPVLREEKDIEAWFNYYVHHYRVVVFAKSFCPYCDHAIDTLHQYTSSVCAVMIDHSSFMNEIQNTFQNKTGARSVPRIFIGGKFVGGCDDILRLDEQNKLQQLIKKAEG